MQIGSQISLNIEAHLHPEAFLIQNKDAGVTLPAPNDATLPPLQPAKKPTRQWAAWTRQEEESFFAALRQVGKNFEKITCRVQSKNKDQVRHYYYRLVRRMNKMLGPGLCLDAKNSKDTNAAMLRWWSLLEKYSCKASKLRLKPRRFKIFLETLENQLLKDRNKNIKKRPSHGENCSPTALSAVSSQSKASGTDTRTVKLILVDSQNISKVGPGKGSLKRNLNIGVTRSNFKGDLISMKAVRQRRKPGTASTAAYRKWEKAAIYGVSLVADAAEHLERTATDKELEQDQGMSDQNDFDPVGKALPSITTFSQNHCFESNIHTSLKLKLQLFPIDDRTRRALEMDEHNPHLELTLSTRKKISSVLEHLNRKWGHSSVASGEIMLFPYDVQRENMVGSLMWTQNSIVNAADVFSMVGSPPVFRLRYGWFSTAELGSVALQGTAASCCIPGQQNMNSENMKGKIAHQVPISVPSTNDQSKVPVDSYKDQLAFVRKDHALASCSTSVPNKIIGFISRDSNNNANSSEPAANISWNTKVTGHGTNKSPVDDVDDDLRLCNSGALSAGEWADSLTNVSVGDLLSDVPHDMEPNCLNSSVIESSQCLQQISFSCDSFDAAIAAHISRHQGKMGFQTGFASQASSLWDAEETCDAFSFQKNHISRHEVQNISSSGPCNEIVRMSSVESGGMAEEVLVMEEGPMDAAAHGYGMDECQSDPQIMNNSPKDFNELTDIYWPDSLGPLDLDIPSTKYHSEDLILSDSLSGLNRLIASSLDAFQNCSFFGLDKKEPASTAGTRETASFSDYKIGSGV